MTAGTQAGAQAGAGPRAGGRWRLLAIDSATERLALAAAAWSGRPDEPFEIHALDLPGGPAASATALPELQGLLARLGWALADLDAVAFGAGPGGFTGLRTACAVAQGLAWGLGCPVVPVDSLALVAEDAVAPGAPALVPAGPGLHVRVAMDARMGEVYTGAYQRRADGCWAVIDAPQLCAPAQLNERLSAMPPDLLAGSAWVAFEGQLATAGRPCVTAERSRAHALAVLALRGLVVGRTVPAELALPVYLRDKVAQTTVEREAIKAAKALAAAQAEADAGVGVGAGAGAGAGAGHGPREPA